MLKANIRITLDNLNVYVENNRTNVYRKFSHMETLVILTENTLFNCPIYSVTHCVL